MLVNKTLTLVCLIFYLHVISYQVTVAQRNNKTEVTDMANRKMWVSSQIQRVYVNKMGAILLYAIDPDLAVCRTLALTQSAKPFLNEKYCNLPYSNGSDEDIIRMQPDIIINYAEINDDSKDKANKQAECLRIPVF